MAPVGPQPFRGTGTGKRQAKYLIWIAKWWVHKGSNLGHLPCEDSWQSRARLHPPKQGQYLAFIDAYTRVNRQPPAERDVQRHFGVTPPTVHQMILALKRTGFIRRTPG